MLLKRDSTTLPDSLKNNDRCRTWISLLLIFKNYTKRPDSLYNGQIMYLFLLWSLINPPELCSIKEIEMFQLH